MPNSWRYFMNCFRCMKFSRPEKQTTYKIHCVAKWYKGETRKQEIVMVSSLKSICLNRLADLLQANYWPIDFESIGFSQFSFLPSFLVEHLLRTIILKNQLSVKDIYPLLTSGRIEEFILRNQICVKWNEFVAILKVLSAYTAPLSTLILQNTCCNVPCLRDRQLALASIIENLLSSCQCLKVVHIGFPFDLKCLQQVVKLENLQLSFSPVNDLRDMVPKVNGQYVINDTITHFSVRKSTLEIKVPADELGFILQHWIGLTYVGNDIAESLEMYHQYELENGLLSKRYKLTKIKLGCSDLNSASSSAIDIAARTCPDVTELEVFIVDNTAPAAISNFQNLEALSITHKGRMHTGNFQFGLNSAIKSVGANLKKLKIDNFSEIELSVIGHFCPNILHLEIKYGTIFNSSQIPSFKHLEHLRLEGKNPIGINKLTLLQFLRQCKKVSYLFLNNIDCFNDEILIKVMSLNSWPELQTAVFCNCSVTENGKQLLQQYSPTSHIIISSGPRLYLPRLEY